MRQLPASLWASLIQLVHYVGLTDPERPIVPVSCRLASMYHRQASNSDLMTRNDIISLVAHGQLLPMAVSHRYVTFSTGIIVVFMTTQVIHPSTIISTHACAMTSSSNSFTAQRKVPRTEAQSDPSKERIPAVYGCRQCRDEQIFRR